MANEGLYVGCCSIKTDSFVVVAYPTIITPGLTSKDDWCLHAGDYFVVAATRLQGDKMEKIQKMKNSISPAAFFPFWAIETESKSQRKWEMGFLRRNLRKVEIKTLVPPPQEERKPKRKEEGLLLSLSCRPQCTQPGSYILNRFQHVIWKK